MDVCPENCLALVPLSQFWFAEEGKARLEAEAPLHADQLQHLRPAELADGEGSVMIKDETICIRCGLCAERCPAKTITMEAYEIFDRDPSLISIQGGTLRS